MILMLLFLVLLLVPKSLNITIDLTIYGGAESEFWKSLCIMSSIS
jgi:hypothetical protein